VNPGESSDHQNRGAAKEMLLSQSKVENRNEYKRVLDDYTEAIRLDPNAPASYYQRGLLRSKVGLKHEAVFDLEKALQIAQAIGDKGMISRIQETLRVIQ